MGGRGAGTLNPRNDNSKWSGSNTGYNITTLKDALGTKGKSKSIGDSVVSTNPNYSGDYKEFSHNCQRVVVAYEMRRRGYDVEALPTYKTDTLPSIAYMRNDGVRMGRWQGAFQNAKPIKVGANTGQKVIDNIDKQMAKFGNGSRGVIQILYKGGGGHVFNVERQGGKTVWIEAQTGRMKNISETMQLVKTGSVQLVRTDNLKISDRTKNFVTTRKRK